MNIEKCIKVLSISILIIVCSVSLIGSASSLPDTYLIKDVPQHTQINGLSCGPAALETMFDYWGEDIDQKSIADVARSSSIGTYTWDMVRTGHFSHLSAANGSFFPHDAPVAGFSERSLGYASFSYSSDTFWWTELKGLIAANIPVLLLMKYAPNSDSGHYRIIVGYDENKDEVYFIDPWGRDQGRVTNPDGTVTWTMADFKNAWNYSKYGTLHPYWGAVMMPWSINLQTTKRTKEGSITVTAQIKYPCPKPFDCSAYPAHNTSVQIRLPLSMHLSAGAPIADIGSLTAGKSVTVSWNVHLDTGAASSTIYVSAGGLVSGSVPQVYWNGDQVSYPAYNYIDEIGGKANITVI
jgi:hypothetical protein